MLFVCQNHVKEGLKIFDAPHIKKMKVLRRCCFCNKHSKYKLFYSTPMSGKPLKKLQLVYNLKSFKEDSFQIKNPS